MSNFIAVFGHGDIFYDNLPVMKEIKGDIISKIENDNFEGIYNGGYGNFDSACAYLTKEIKKDYPHFKSYLVLAYPNPKWDEIDKKRINEKFDEHFVPDIGYVPAKFAISKRNEWIIDNADYIIFYIDHKWGGAYNAYLYAKRKKKAYKNYGSLKL